MNPNEFKQIRLNFSGAGCWLTLLAVVWLLGAVGLGWLVKSVLVLMVLLLITPILAFVGFRWWLKRNLVQSKCPVCDYPLAGLNESQSVCPSCGTALEARDGQFMRTTPAGTIEVSAIEVPVEVLQDGDSPTS